MSNPGQPGLAQSILDLYPSFQSGFQPIDGGQLWTLANQVNGGKSGLTALAGGGQGATTTQLAPGINEVATVVTANDSVMLPMGIPNQIVVVINDGANSVQVFGQPSNPSNNNAGDTIAPHGSVVQNASATGVAQASAAVSQYICFAIGKWKQTLMT